MTRLSLPLLSILATSDAFSSIGILQTRKQPSLAFNLQTPVSTLSAAGPLYSSNNSSNEDEKPSIGKEGEEEEEEKTPTPISDALQMQSAVFQKEPERQERLDPLIASLTRMDDDMKNTPTIKVPLLGEIPLDGSIVVLLPVAIIAVVGFIMSINIAFESKDSIVEKVGQVNRVMSTPPAKVPVVPDGCRGLCSDQDAQLDTMRNFMNSLAKKAPETAVVEEIKQEAVVVEEVREVIKAEAAAPAVVTEEAPVTISGSVSAPSAE